jgi:branched-chain amino acid aminotransferase
VWEPLRVFRGQIFRAADHLAQLFAAAAALRIDIPLSQNDLLAAVEATVRANDRTEGYVRVIVTRGPGTIGPDPRKLDPQVFITAEEYLPFPTELYAHGLHTVTAPCPLAASNPADFVRTLGQPGVVLAKAHALANGCLEAVLVDAGRTTEGNLFAVQGGKVLRFPARPADVAAEVVEELARDAGIPTEPAPSPGTKLTTFDELFTAGTSCGVIGVVRVDGTDVGAGAEGPVTRTLRERYRILTRGE